MVELPPDLVQLPAGVLHQPDVRVLGGLLLVEQVEQSADSSNMLPLSLGFRSDIFSLLDL